ncbi:unnamed protein product [Camellia sinensis]
MVLALPDRIQAMPDGTAAAPKQSGGWTGSASRTEIKFDSGDWLPLFYSFFFPSFFFFLGGSYLRFVVQLFVSFGS